MSIGFATPVAASIARASSRRSARRSAACRSRRDDAVQVELAGDVGVVAPRAGSWSPRRARPCSRSRPGRARGRWESVKYAASRVTTTSLMNVPGGVASSNSLLERARLRVVDARVAEARAGDPQPAAVVLDPGRAARARRRRAPGTRIGRCRCGGRRPRSRRSRRSRCRRSAAGSRSPPARTRRQRDLLGIAAVSSAAGTASGPSATSTTMSFRMCSSFCSLF